MTQYPIPLPGCTPEPLMNYLKALGVLRLVSEQVDAGARGSWRDGKFVLYSKGLGEVAVASPLAAASSTASESGNIAGKRPQAGTPREGALASEHATEEGASASGDATGRAMEEALLEFFVNEYRPSPILSPWNGEGGFLTETGTSFETIAALRASTDPRLATIRSVIEAIDGISALREFGEARLRSKELEKKKKRSGLSAEEGEELKEVKSRVKSLKEDILYQIRTEFPDASLGWLDACLLVGTEGFATAPVLGSGGVDGRMEFSANFLANILLLLEHKDSRGWLEQALFLRGDAPLLDTSVGQFAPGSIGGPNATQGFEGGSIVNPWDYVLMIEGAVLLAGTVSRRFNAHAGGKAAFPFTVFSTAAGSGSLANSESNSARGEFWTPLWHRALSLPEVRRLFGEGRAELAGRQSRTAVDFARAASSFGVDRGIESFARHGFLQRNGLAFLATPLGRFEVRHQNHVDLLRDIDPWLDRFRRACTDKAPARFRSALRRIDDAIFNYCRYGERFFQGILVALGQAERELANGGSFTVNRENNSVRVPPLSSLREEWVHAADDHSPEFAIAAALASLSDKREKGTGSKKKYLGPLRFNMEPVAFRKEGGRLTWTQTTPAVVWHNAGLAANLAAVLQRRVMDWNRFGLEEPPWRAERSAPAETIAAFLYDELDNEKIQDLLRGLILCRIPPGGSGYERGSREGEPISRAYSLLKLFFIHLPEKQPDELLPKHSPHPLAIAPGDYEKLHTLRPDNRLVRLLLSGQIEESLQAASQKLRAKMLRPVPIDWRLENPTFTDPARLAAALLIPVSTFQAVSLWKSISRSKDTREVQTSQEL